MIHGYVHINSTYNWNLLTGQNLVLKQAGVVHNIKSL